MVVQKILYKLFSLLLDELHNIIARQIAEIDVTCLDGDNPK